MLEAFHQNPSDLPGVADDYKIIVKKMRASIFDVINRKMGTSLAQNLYCEMHYKEWGRWGRFTNYLEKQKYSKDDTKYVPIFPCPTVA